MNFLRRDDGHHGITIAHHEHHAKVYIILMSTVYKRSCEKMLVSAILLRDSCATK